MNITFLGQGFQDDSRQVGGLLVQYLQEDGFHSFTGISAFASRVGINGLAGFVEIAKNNFQNLNIIVGIAHGGTSKEALDELMKLKVNSFVFHLEKGAIFHPKIYLFEGDEKTRLIIGSSNLTGPGLWSNIEASLLVEFDGNDEEGKALVNDMKEYFKRLFDFSEPNLFRLTPDLIPQLVEKYKIPIKDKELTAEETAEKSDSKGNKPSGGLFPKRKIQAIPVWFLKRASKSKKPKPTEPAAAITPSEKGNLVWVSKKLPASSVQATGGGTNPTGGLRLVQDKFMVGGKVIHHPTYFRQKVFGKFPWKEIKENPFVEATTVEFDIFIQDVFMGRFYLQVRHKPSGAANQGNYTTSISWGKAGDKIKESSLTGRRLELFAPKGRQKVFRIEIT